MTRGTVIHHRLAIAYLVICAISVVAYSLHAAGWLGPPHDHRFTVAAVALGLPWSIGMGLWLHPDAMEGLLIIVMSQLLNAGILQRICNRLSRH